MKYIHQFLHLVKYIGSLAPFKMSLKKKETKIEKEITEVFKQTSDRA